MNYKVCGRNDITDIKGCIFENRGVADIKTYTHLTDDVIIPYWKLDNINDAVDVFVKHMEKHSKISIVVDCDVDGQCSASMIYMYIKSHIDKDANITYLIHSGKQHGLSSDIEIPEGTELLIIPDAGTNDTEQCKMLTEKGIDIIILDHHEKEKDNPYAIVVNNQCSINYNNKELCGAGVVYKFLQALDEYYWTDNADNYLDLVTLANISDVMDLRSFETKRLIDKGLNVITNKCFEEFINAQTFLMKGKVNPHTVAFCITSLINAMCRVGNSEEKDLLFRAFTEQDEEFEYKKRGETTPTTETIYERAVRLCKNAKSRQDKQVNGFLPNLEKKYSASNNSVLFIKGDDIPNVFSGIVAMKLADKFKKPCLVLRGYSTDENNKVFRGSARNFDNSYVSNFKDLLESTNKFNWCQGHQGAFGVEIKGDNVKGVLSELNVKCEKADKRLPVDFEIDYTDFDVSIITDITSLEDYYGTGIKEPMLIIKNLVLEANQGSLMGKEKNTWKFTTDDYAIIKFKNSANDPVLNFFESFEDTITIDALCQVEVSEYKGIITPQITIKDYEVVK